jgi:dihydrofolate reductase
MVMNLIVAVDKSWGIGCSGNLLQVIPEDMQFFKNMTTGKAVILGRKTLYTFPLKKPLKNRKNIILSTDKNFQCEDAQVYHSVIELFQGIKELNSDDVFIIGGEAVYKELLNYCKYAYVTKIFREYEADRFFPNLDVTQEWQQIEESEVKCYEHIEYQFTVYENTEVKSFID